MSRAIDRRYCGLTVARFLPTGLEIPVLGLLMLSRGLTLAQLGFGVAAQAVMVIALELPTGGLADALGRRPVLLVATALDAVALGLVLIADSPLAFMAAMAVEGVYRALESGPLDAWYVDASLAADAGTDIEAGLAKGATATGLGVSAGALATAGLTSLPEVAGIDPLALPIGAALALRLVDLAAIWTFLAEPRLTETRIHETRPGPQGPGAASADRPSVAGEPVQPSRIPAGAAVVDPASGGRRIAAVRASVAATPRVVRSALRLLRTTPALLALVAVELSWGSGLTGVELFTAPRLAELLGDAEQGAAVSALAAAVAWSVAATGSACTRQVGRIVTGGPARVGAVLRLVQGGAVAVAALVAGPAGMLAGYLGFYLAHGTANAVHYGMVHRLVGAEHRATIISAHSVAARAGGMVTAVGLGALATSAGIPLALGIAAVALAAAAPLYRIAGRAVPQEPARAPAIAR